MRQVSARRRRRDAGYPAARLAVWDRSGGLCEAAVSNRCSGRCEQVHHRAGRGGPNPHDLGNLVGLCAGCHEWVHGHPVLARELGWMVSRLASES